MNVIFCCQASTFIDVFGPINESQRKKTVSLSEEHNTHASFVYICLLDGISSFRRKVSAELTFSFFFLHFLGPTSCLSDCVGH